MKEHYPNTAPQDFEKSTPSFSIAFDAYRICLGRFTHDNAEAIIAAFTIILALSTIFLWVATRDLVTGAEKTAERQLRAYVSVAPVRITNINPGRVITVIYNFTNHGLTPAHKVVQASVIRLEHHPLPRNFRFPDLAGIERPSRIVLPPSSPIPGQALAERRFTQNEMIEILQAPRQGGRRLYIFGQVDYIDAFRKPRWTRFCISFPGRPDLMSLAQQGNWAAIDQILEQPGSTVSFEFATQHNETEND